MTFRSLSKELRETAQHELNEVSDRIQEDLNYIREWLSTKPHLTVRKDDQWLLTYLRRCKYNFQRTKDKLELYYIKKLEIPEFFSNRDPFLPEIQEVLRRGLIVILPKTATPASPKIIFFRANRSDPVIVPVATFIKVLLMILDILYTEDDNSVITGVCYITDLNGMSYKYLTQLTPNHVKKVIDCMLRAYPTRLKGGYFLNAPSFFQIVFKLARILLPAKLKDRLRFYNDFDDLNEVPKSILPNDYGGEEKSCDEIAAEWKLKVESYRDWFLEEAYEGEMLTKPKADEQTLDVERSFEKLEID